MNAAATASAALLGAAVGLVVGGAFVLRRTDPALAYTPSEDAVQEWLNMAAGADTYWGAEHAYAVGQMLGLPAPSSTKAGLK